jgi:hypothetical protein
LLLAFREIVVFITAHHAFIDLGREAANLVSRGATIEAAVAAVTVSKNGPVDVEDNGLIIISTLQRHSPGDAKPWVVDQYRTGAVAGGASRVGRVNSHASVPNLETLEPGVTVMAVEVMHAFEPLFPIGAFGLNFFPEVVYEAAFF